MMHPLVQLKHLLASVLSSTLLIGAICGIIYFALHKSEDSKRIILKLAFTVALIAVATWLIDPFSDRPARWEDMVVSLLSGLILLVTWRHSIGAAFSRPIEGLLTGGDTPPDPQPFYSIAEARRKLGRYPDAISEIRKQLEKFPTDYTGQMMLAEIQAQNLDDLPGAELTINRIVAQGNHAPLNIAHALSTLADWHLKYTLDREAARADLERIIQLLPGTEQAHNAEQRISHLASTDKLIAPHDRQRIIVREGIQNLGLRKPEDVPKPVETDVDQITANYVKHLSEFPRDFDVRERLALLYADHFKRLDLATDQLDQMIEAENQPAKKVIHWLNLMADLQVRHGADFTTVERTLERILDRFGNMPDAQTTRNRLSHLKLEFRTQVKGVRLKMGTYEQNIGLKKEN